MSYSIAIRDIKQLAPGVKQIRTDKPKNFQIKPGQAAQLSVDKPDLRDRRSPFFFTSLDPEHDLEFIIKVSSDQDEVTSAIDRLSVSDRLIMQEPWQALQYKGPGLFLAHGIGITAFVAMLRRLREDDELEGHRLIWSAGSAGDFILEDEFEAMFGPDFIQTLSGRDESDEYLAESVSRDFLEQHLDGIGGEFYVCGPPEFVAKAEQDIQHLGGEPTSLVYENIQMAGTR